MNEESKLTDEELRLATSRALPCGAALNAETAAARDDFLALGSALESASHPFDEAALIARLSKTCLRSASTTDPQSKPRRSVRDWWTIALGSALAASAVVALVRIATESQPTAVIAKVEQSPIDVAAPSRSAPPITLAAAWNDPLDDEIALAAATIDRITGRRSGFDGSLRDIGERLESLSQELDAQSL